jgi:hypothetical protein
MGEHKTAINILLVAVYIYSNCCLIGIEIGRILRGPGVVMMKSSQSWPNKRTEAMFDEWFEFEFHPMIFELGRKRIRKR